MAVFDRIKTTSTSTTSPFVVSTSPPTGYLGFSKFANGATDIPVAIVHQTANEWQVCYCSWNSATNELTVTSVLLSTNADAAVTFSAGTKDVFVTGSSRSLGHLREVNTWAADQILTTSVAPTSTGSLGFRGAPQNDQTGAYTFVLSDAGKVVMFKGTTAATWTIPKNTTANFPIGSMIIVDNSHFSNSGGAVVTISGASGVGIRDARGAAEPTTARGYSKQVTRGGVVTLRKLANAGSTQTPTSITRSGATATLTTSAAHGWTVGDHIEVLGAAQSQYNGTQRILTVPTSTTLTYLMTADPGATASGTITVGLADLWNATGNFNNV